MPIEVYIAALLAYAVSGALELGDGRVRNWLCAAIALIGLYRWMSPGLLQGADRPWTDVAWPLAIAVIVFLVGMAAFMLRWIGGGGVKLMAASVLLLGAEDTPAFLLLMLLVGAVLAALLLTLARFGWSIRTAAPAARGAGSTAARRGLVIPFGVAIAIAAAITLTLQFRHA